MQTASVNLLPVDPAPAHDRRETADRGFADYLRGDEPPAAKADRRPSRPMTDRRDNLPTERGATAGRPDDRTGKTETAADETSDRAAPDAAPADGVAGDTPSDSIVAVTAEPTAATTPTGKPDIPISPAAPQPGSDEEAGYIVSAEAGQTAGITTATASAQPAATGDTATVPPAETGAEAAGRDAEAASRGAAAADMSAVPAEAVAPKTTQAPVTAAPPSATEQTAVPLQPAAANIAPAAPEAAAAASAVVTPIVATATGTTRQATGATGAPSPTTAPATPAAAADAGETAATPTQADGESGAGVKPADSAQGQNRAGNGAAQATPAAQTASAAQPGEQAARTAVPDPSTAGIESSPRGADAPPSPGQQASTGGQTGTPPTSFAGELRLATGATPQPEAAAARPAPAPVVNQMAVNISRAVSEGQDRLTIDLKPAALGRVSVSLELGHDHRVIAVISADRADTLDLLQRDARTLERALQDAGLKTDSGSLSFSLNGDGAKESPAQDAEFPGQFVAAQPSDDEADASPAPYNPYSGAVNLTGIDIHV